ncbi:very long chain fatty acid elongase 7-like [Culicoides brevitarsis]|uniref:very long chain fatty acid elongase 7-like n=1 Tax=Culicoides brevitarsis TaxID=469753 RepID=UPI00307CC541
MLEFLQKLNSGARPELDSLFLFSTPLIPIAIMATYMSFVLHYGPKWMQNRQPFNLKYVILAYNLMQVCYNAWMVQESVRTIYVWDMLKSFGCTPALDEVDTSLLMAELARGFWHYTFNKILDLLDTVFFVLTKKQSHVTFLHVHHHSLMVSFLWFIAKYYPGIDGGIVGFCNTIVHTVMYFYYFIAALGPAYRKYLWWKSYLTLLQITQFVIIILYILVAVCMCGKNFNLYIITFIMAETMFNLYLFTSFYFKSYKNTNKKTQ